MAVLLQLVTVVRLAVLVLLLEALVVHQEMVELAELAERLMHPR
jgi:hypothetical protein